MNTIYLVFARWDYEGDSAIKAFEDEAEADAFAARCSEHHERMPRTTPPIGDSAENNAAWDAWQAEKTEWDNAHPAGESNTTADSFIVIGVPFVAKDPS